MLQPTMTRRVAPITIFTPSDADSSNTNAQNLTVKEIVARLPEDQFHVTMLCGSNVPDARIANRMNTRLVEWTNHGNTLRLLRHCLLPPPDIYFFPRTGPLERTFFAMRKRLGLKTALITYIVMAMDAATSRGTTGRSIVEGDMVFSNSHYVSETIRQMFGIGSTPIYDGIDRRHYFPPVARPENAAPTVLYAGSFQPRKRVDIVIRQAARLPGLQFRLAGKGETDKQCRDLVQQLGCKNVSFLGHLTSEGLGEEMRKADIFFFPSVLEGNPQVLLQAGACGLACIAMDTYRSDYVVNGKTGFLVGSDAELAESLDRLAGDFALREAFAAAAISYANQFDWEKIAAQWASVFQQAVAKRQRNPQPHDFQRAS
ncbi:MAG: glycosyltransferase family 4 protein [Candidatus Sulfotelmatobacter sp.]